MILFRWKNIRRVGFSTPTPNHHAIATDKGIKGLWVDPVPAALIIDEINSFALTAGVEPIRIPGYWLDKKGLNIPIGEAPAPGEKVAYCLHGGAYALISASTQGLLRPLFCGILKYCPSVRRTFSIEYRLSVGHPYVPANPFPAALLDALAGYVYLIDIVGYKPTDIIVVGDSAGGNLALALTRYLVENHAQIMNLPAPPSAMVLLSPWCDLSNSHYTPNSSLDFASYDVVPDPRIGATAYCRDAFLGLHGMAAAKSSRYFSPSCLLPSMETVSFKGFPRTFIHSGDAETLLDQIRTLRDRMVQDMGEGPGEGQVVYYETVDGVHDLVAMPFWEPARGETLRRIAEWVSFEG
jgi:acetyl esterase/lipase